MIPIFGTMYFGRIKSIIKKFFKINKNFLKVLEVGGGFGLFSVNFKKNFPKSEVHLLDLYSNEIMNLIQEIISNKLKIKLIYHFECDIIKKTPFNRKTFDLIYALDILEHLQNPEVALTEIIRILKDDGYLFISVPTESILLQLARKLFK